MDETPILSIAGLSKSFGSTRVLDGLTLYAHPGETIAIIGRSGSGKSTLLKCITLLDLPDSGELALDGQTYFSNSQVLYQPWEIRRNIALVFQDFNLFPNMTVLDNISFALRKVRNFKRGEARDRARAMAKNLGIGDAVARYPNELSGGQAQRCALARALVLDPKIFLLDEITSALDPETVLNVSEAIREVKGTDKSGRMAMIVVTHLMRFAESFSDRIAFLHRGKIHEELPAQDFFSRCEKPETKSFVAAFHNKL